MLEEVSCPKKMHYVAAYLLEANTTLVLVPPRTFSMHRIDVDDEKCNLVINQLKGNLAVDRGWKRETGKCTLWWRRRCVWWWRGVAEAAAPKKEADDDIGLLSAQLHNILHASSDPTWHCRMI